MTVEEGVVPPILRAHWGAWLGATPEELKRLVAPGSAGSSGPTASLVPRVTVVGSPRRTEPGWDGEVHQVVGVIDPQGTAVVSVRPADLGWAQGIVAGGGDLDDLRREIPGRLGLPDHVVYRATYRFTTAPAGSTELPDVGTWLPVTDPLVPPWLQPFGAMALVVLDTASPAGTDGAAQPQYVAGVGLKRHDSHAHEIAVVTDEAARGRGLARRLVAQAARRLLARGIVPTYLHDPANVASARVAAAAGLPDLGWTALGLAERTPTDEEHR